jgi:hypothetical protein
MRGMTVITEITVIPVWEAACGRRVGQTQISPTF